MKALSGAKNADFPSMKKWIQEHLKAAAEKKIAASKEENVLLADVIEVLSLLTKFGYYDSLDDIRDLLQYLLEILNGFTDLCAPNKGKYLACIRPSTSTSIQPWHTVHFLPGETSWQFHHSDYRY